MAYMYLSSIPEHTANIPATSGNFPWLRITERLRIANSSAKAIDITPRSSNAWVAFNSSETMKNGKCLK